MKCIIKNRSRIIIFVTELLILLSVIISLIIPNKSYSISPDSFSDNATKLGPGRYIVCLEYATDAENILVSVSSGPDNSSRNNGNIIAKDYILKPAYTNHSFEFWVTGTGRQVSVNVEFLTEEPAEVESLVVYRTSFIEWNVLIAILTVIAVTLLTWLIRDKIIKLNKDSVITAAILTAVIIFLSFPLFTPYVYMGFDTKFHMIRIEGIKDGLLAGQFPVRIDPTFINGFGYAVPTYYGSLFFYFPALLRLIGYTLQTSFKALCIMINCIIVISSYKCFKEIGSGRRIGIAGSVLYSASVYRFCNMYQRGAIGESIAMAVLPVIALALWNIYTKPHDQKYKSRWIMLTAGFTLVLHSHIISTGMFAALSVLICLINFKKTFQKDTFIVLLKFLVTVCLINLGFLVPFIQGLLGFPMVINQWGELALEFQHTGVFLKDIFSVQLPAIWKAGIPETALCYYVGIAPGLGILAVIAVLFTKQLKNREYVKTYILFAVLSVIMILISTNSFPWNAIFGFCAGKLGRIGRYAVSLATKVQFAFRYLVFATFILTCAVIYSLRIIQNKNRKVSNIFITVLMVTALAQCMVLEISNTKITVVCKGTISSIKDTDDLDNQFCIGGEYLPVVGGASVWHVMGERTCHTNLMIDNFNKEYTNVAFTVTNDSDVQDRVEVPLLYYPGYEAVNAATGEKIELIQSPAMRLACEIPAHTQMDVQIRYKGKILWRVADIISAVSMIAVIVIRTYSEKIIHEKKEALAIEKQN